MKKIISLILAVMPCLLLHSQEAEVGNYAEFSIIPRFEFLPEYSPQDGFNFSHGNSSISSLFEGKYKKFSWMLENHWLHSGGEYDWPYTSLGYSNTTNLIDLMNVSYSPGDFTFTVGKQMMAVGGIEFEFWDWDAYTGFQSPLWNYKTVYQWGLGVTWEPIRNNSFTLQWTKSPHGEKVLKDKLFAYTAQWRGEYDWATFLYGVSFMQDYQGHYSKLITLGQSFYLGSRWTASLDLNHCEDINCSSAKASVRYDITEKVSAQLVGVYESCNKGRIYGGAIIDYNINPDLRLFTTLGYSHNFANYQNLLFNLGVRWWLRILK